VIGRTVVRDLASGGKGNRRHRAFKRAAASVTL